MTEKQCEICGAEISGAPQRIVIDGSALEVCKGCARFGKPEDKWSPVPRKMVPAERAFTVTRPKPRDHFKDLVEIVPDFGRKIRESREGVGLSLEELAVRIKEKATLLRKIEREEISPEDEIRKKLERELKISLTDQASEARFKSGLSGRGLTLGDIASIKRKSER
ncbi:MAG: multiprotein bridging factor aMBF1 [Methanothrix sp.]|nr:multiprotein bridging factor aMBF1 [Methanothrix sp.]MDD1726330.1 multiprotein bridging factor aMBF1 [Methanothrix sp.]MDD1741557.1 multiprotein bridging factor aMBF1 [Methanothrix sp.]OYV09189.1 MAG: putative transcription factor [Methanosaeta sp. NSP1]OYV10579.1 MAG: putative transcription factor [Methanosaeta sp. ASO1]